MKSLKKIVLPLILSANMVVAQNTSNKIQNIVEKNKKELSHSLKVDYMNISMDSIQTNNSLVHTLGLGVVNAFRKKDEYLVKDKELMFAGWNTVKEYYNANNKTLSSRTGTKIWSIQSCLKDHNYPNNNVCDFTFTGPKNFEELKKYIEENEDIRKSVEDNSYTTATVSYYKGTRLLALNKFDY